MDTLIICRTLIKGPICIDINECTEGGHDCYENANCINTEGSFTCEETPETTTQPSVNAVLVLSTRYSSNKPMIVDFDGK